jgi:competence protein ComEA
MLLLSSYLFGAINVQTASKAELMSISGIGEKKADAIIKYRKKHKLKSADDLLKVPGIGQGIVKNVKGNVKNKQKPKAKNKKEMKKKKSQKKQMKKPAKKQQKKKKMKKSSKKKSKKAAKKKK